MTTGQKQPMSAFNDAFDTVVVVEGGYSDHASDRGGKTKYGITERVARANGYEGAMDALTIADARSIYRSQYWDTLRLDEISALSPQIALELFDTGVNTGIGTAGKFLQRALNALNQQGSIYADLAVDGLLGPVSVAALRAFLKRRQADGETVLLRALNGLQTCRYIEIAERDPQQEDFVFGWIKNRVTL